MTAGQLPVAYPVQFGVDYPEAERNRLTVAFRIVLAIPAVIVLGVLNSTRALLFLPPLLLILFRNKYPGGGSTGTCSCCGSKTGWFPTCSCCGTSTRRPTRNRRCTSTSATRTWPPS